MAEERLEGAAGAALVVHAEAHGVDLVGEVTEAEEVGGEEDLEEGVAAIEVGVVHEASVVEDEGEAAGDQEVVDSEVHSIRVVLAYKSTSVTSRVELLHHAGMIEARDH